MNVAEYRRRVKPLLLGIVFVNTASLSSALRPAPLQVLKVAKAASPSSAHDFDFLYGYWKVHNRLLKTRLANSHEWIEFEASDAFHPLPGNLGSEENYRTDHWPNFFAIGLHLYDPVNKKWTLYWADNRNSPGTMQTLAAGAFSGGIGAFYAPDKFNGKPITVRILWKRVDQNHARWEQAFSTDGGNSWETNWTMDFVRQHATRP